MLDEWNVKRNWVRRNTIFDVESDCVFGLYIRIFIYTHTSATMQFITSKLKKNKIKRGQIEFLIVECEL